MLGGVGESAPGGTGDLGQSPLPLGVQLDQMLSERTACLQVSPDLSSMGRKPHGPRDLPLQEAGAEGAQLEGGGSWCLSPKPPAFSGKPSRRTTEGCLSRGRRPGRCAQAVGGRNLLDHVQQCHQPELALAQPLRSSSSGFLQCRWDLGVRTDPPGALHGSQGAAQAKWQGPRPAPRRPELSF